LRTALPVIMKRLPLFAGRAACSRRNLKISRGETVRAEPLPCVCFTNQPNT